MKKNYKLVIVSILLSTLTYAQVGVGTSNPSAGLDVISKGNTNATKALEINNAANTEMVTVLDNGNVGIGNPIPATKLDINNGTTLGAIKIVDGSQGVGKVLTSDANGIGSWSSSTTNLYFLSSNPILNRPTDFSITTSPAPGTVHSTPFYNTTRRYLTSDTDLVFNYGPTTAYTPTPGTSGAVSYTIPENGLYRIILYVDGGYGTSPTDFATIEVSAFRGTNEIRVNRDYVHLYDSSVMVNTWQLNKDDIVIPASVNVVLGTTTGTIGKLVETNFSVERLK